MSNPFGNFGGIVIHQDASENPGQRKTKRDELQGKPPANKRAALGTITNTTRIQPFRAAKQGAPVVEGFGGVLGNENAKAKAFGGVAQPFSIHCDDGSSLSVQEHQQSAQHRPRERESSGEKLQLHPAITTLTQPALVPAPQPIVIDAESPMVLDTSTVVLDTSTDSQRDLTEQERLNRIVSVPEYSQEIYWHLRDQEEKHRAKPYYMKRQPDITTSMRCILVDWLVEVAEEYKLTRETLFLSVNYIDRFLSQMSVLRGKLQLVGAASMFLAAKYEEIYPPEVGEFVYITDDTYTKKQVLRMEHLILKVLSFDVAVPTINIFCERFLRDIGADDRTRALTYFLSELTLVEGDPFLGYKSSEIAAGIVCLANHTLGKEAMSQTLREKTGYDLSELSDVLRDLHGVFSRSQSHPQQAVREKYRLPKYLQVFQLEPPVTLPGNISLTKDEESELVEL